MSSQGKSCVTLKGNPHFCLQNPQIWTHLFSSKEIIGKNIKQTIRYTMHVERDSLNVEKTLFFVYSVMKGCIKKSLQFSLSLLFGRKKKQTNTTNKKNNILRFF